MAHKSSKKRSQKKHWTASLAAWTGTWQGKWVSALFVTALIYFFLWVLYWNNFALQQNLNRLTISYYSPAFYDFLLHFDFLSTRSYVMWMFDFSIAAILFSTFGTMILIFMVQLLFVPPSMACSQEGNRLDELIHLRLPQVNHLRDFIYTSKGLDCEKIDEEQIFIQAISKQKIQKS